MFPAFQFLGPQTRPPAHRQAVAAVAAGRDRQLDHHPGMETTEGRNSEATSRRNVAKGRDSRPYMSHRGHMVDPSRSSSDFQTADVPDANRNSPAAPLRLRVQRTAAHSPARKHHAMWVWLRSKMGVHTDKQLATTVRMTV